LCFYIADHSIIITIAVHTNLNPKSSQLFVTAWRVGDLTLFKALTGVAFDRLNWQHSGEFGQNFSKKLNAPGFARGEGHGRFWN